MRRSQYKAMLCQNIDYPILQDMYAGDVSRLEQLDELVELAIDAMTTTRASLRVGRESFPAEVVRSRLLKLTAEHMSYLLESLAAAKPAPVRNIHAYMLTALYRAPSTLALSGQADFSARFYFVG